MLITKFFSFLCFATIAVQINSSIIAKRAINIHNLKLFEEVGNKISDYHKHRLIYLFIEFFLIATQAFSNNTFGVTSENINISKVYGISTCCLIIISTFYSHLNYSIIETVNEAYQKLKEKQNKKTSFR